MTLRRALALSYVEKYGSYAISLGSTIVISRLLSPEQVGVFAVAMAIVGLIAVIRELGISTYLVQELELSDVRIRAAFTLAMALGLALAIVAAIISSPMSSLYSNDEVGEVMLVLAISFALTPLGSVSQSLLARELRFGSLAWIRLLYAVVQAVCGIALVYKGLGPLALAWATVVAAVANGIVSLAVKPHSLVPCFKATELRRVFSIGGPVTLVGILDDLASALPELVVGRTQGLAAAGLFSRAKGLSQIAHQLIVRAANPVFFTAFASLRRENQDTAPLYLRATSCVTGLGWAILAPTGVLATPIILILFGKQWLEAADLLRWLCLAAGLSLLSSGAAHLLLASDGAKDVVLAKLRSLPILIACVAVGAYIDVYWLAAGVVVGSGAGSLFLWVAVQRRTEISLRRQFKSAAQSLPIAFAGAFGALPGLLVNVHSAATAIQGVIIGSITALASIGAVIFVTNHPLRAEVSRLVPRRQSN